MQDYFCDDAINISLLIEYIIIYSLKFKLNSCSYITFSEFCIIVALGWI